MDQNTTVFKPQKDESKRVKEIMEHTVNLLVPLEVSTDFGTDLYETK